jgi:hypothetical protein
MNQSSSLAGACSARSEIRGQARSFCLLHDSNDLAWWLGRARYCSLSSVRPQSSQNRGKGVKMEDVSPS